MCGPKYILNKEVFYNMLAERRMGINDFAKLAGLTRQTLWRITLPVDHPKFGYVTENVLRKFRKAFNLKLEEAKKLFILP